MAEYVYVATVGKTPEKVLIGLRCRLNIKKVCLIGSDDEEVKRCTQSIKEFSEKLGYAVEITEADAFNVLDVTDHVNDVIRRHKQYSVVVNISSGTRVMTIGSLLAACINNSEVIYVPQQVSEKNPICMGLPSVNQLIEKVTLPKTVLVREEEILPELAKRIKEDHPTLSIETLQVFIKGLLQNKFEFEAWDTRFEPYPRLVYVHEKTETKLVREDLGAHQMVVHFNARCNHCKSWFTFPLEIGLGYLPAAMILSQGRNPPAPEPAPLPFNSYEYVNLLRESRRDFYCPRCTLNLRLKNVVDRLKKTQTIV